MMHQSWSALYEVRVRNWANVNFETPRAMIGGRRVLKNSKLKSPYFRYNYFEKQAYFSAYHISNETAIDYIFELNKVKSEYLVGYAMSIYLLARNMNRLKLKPPKLKAVLTSSEKLTNDMRKTIEIAFKCKVYDAYSGIEACGLISENEFGELLFSPDSGILEVINKKGEDSKLGEIGEVISTGFLNYDQPLIRYRIGDQVILDKNQKTKSNINFPKIKEIYGRNEDVIVGKDGREMVRFHGVFININGLIMAQVIQISYTQIVIKLVVDSNYNISSEKQIETRIKSQLSDINVVIKYVNSIENDKNGKYKAVISNFKND
jgi:phenylacetate-CoA ligase